MSITAMKHALSALERCTKFDQRDYDAMEDLRTAIAEAEKQEPCPYCNDSGDVHSFDGEWRGRCTCPAGQPAPKQEPIMAGYQLVPVEPTDKMVQASLHLDLSYMPLQEGYDRAAVYKAMLAAAPVQAQPALKQDQCWCDATGIGEPGVSCGDCPKDYTAPVQAQSDHIANAGKMGQPLTFDQIEDIWIKHGLNECDCHGFARAIEQAHGIKVQP